MAAGRHTPSDDAASTWPDEVVPLFDSAMACDYASRTPSGRPITWPLTPYREPGGATLDVSTGLTYPGKAERARQDARVALLYADAAGSGLPDPPVVMVQGLATVRDADLQAGTDRYVRASRAKTPNAYKGLPSFVLRRMDWYLGRVWIEVTPLRMLWWPSGQLDREPRRWEAPAGTTAPPSDPGPTGPPLPPRSAPLADWRATADRAARLGAPTLTVVGDDGWPLPVRCRGSQRVVDGFVVAPPVGVTLPAGPACLTFSWQDLKVGAQENVVLVGTAAATDDAVRVRVDRALPDWSITGNRLRRIVGFLANGRRLRPRLAGEAARRGQPVPVVRILRA